MTKNELRIKGFAELKGNGENEKDTMYKRLDNGNMRIVQFNEKLQPYAIGIVCISEDQIKNIFK